MSDTLNGALSHSIQSIPECLGAGYMDITCGLMLGVKSADTHPVEVIEFLADATADFFQGPNVAMIEHLFKKGRGLENDARHYFQEMVVNSDNLLHIFLRGRLNQEHVVCFVCRNSANLGLALAKARASLPELENSL